MKMKIAGIAMFCLVAILFYLGWRIPPLDENHGKMDTHLYLSEGNRQPLLVGFGGGSGGNDWERNYLKSKRDSIRALGYAVLAIGYFKTENSPSSLDRISLDAIADTIRKIARRTPQIDTSRIYLMGGSKGGELVLNLASRYAFVKGVIAMSTSDVSFPALTLAANTSSWMYQNKEVNYVPAPFRTIWPAIKGDLYGAFAIMLENSQAVAQAGIEVEKINGPVVILSGNRDEQWPATQMSNRLMDRLQQNEFKHFSKHIILEGSHISPLDHFNQVYRFLDALNKRTLPIVQR